VKPHSPADALFFGPFQLRPTERALLRDGQPVPIGVRALDVLIALALRRDQVVSADDLLELAWPGLVVEPNNLQVQISAVRKLLGVGSISTIKRRGYQFIARCREPDPVAAEPAFSKVRGLPTPRTRFVGRHAALADACRLLADRRLLTLTGTGGCGKTRFAIEVVHRSRPLFSGALWFVELAPVGEHGRLAAIVARAVHAGEDFGGDPFDALAARIGASRALLVLDNCEHLVADVASLVDRLLAACAGLHVLATSREGLGLAGEQIFAVGTLDVPPAVLAELATPAGRCVDVDALSNVEAVQLFADRAQLAQAEFRLSSANASAVAEICRRLDGIPLAIELAAARMRVLPVDEIRARLDDRFRFLVGGQNSAPRHRTLGATLEWSVRLLPEPEVSAFARLSVFDCGCTLAAATAATGLDDEYEALQILTQLHDKSLLTMVYKNLPEPRFRMLETVRQFAQDRLDGDAGDGLAVRVRCLAFFVEFAEEASLHLHDRTEVTWMERVSAEESNLIAAHEWCADLPEGAGAGWRLVAALDRYWMLAGALDVGYRLGRSALAREPRDLDGRTRCRALLAMSQLAYRRGLHDEALRWAQRSFALADMPFVATSLESLYEEASAPSQ
jgi:predicted ATPase/DNA-binding winged helix-turn-helix (wHTH) protein